MFVSPHDGRGCLVAPKSGLLFVLALTLCALCLAAFGASRAEAGAELSADLQPGAAGSDPTDLAVAGDTLYFVIGHRDPRGRGDELWKVEGARGAAALLREFSGFQRYGAEVQSLTDVDGRLFFLETQLGQHRLWTSDGTPAGTKAVAKADDDWIEAATTDLINVAGTLFFVAHDSEYGDELWRSNGTPAGTRLVADINPGRESSRVQHLTNVNGTLFFTANDGSGDLELWKSNGTEAGTIKVRPGAGAPQNVEQLTSAGGTLFFLVRGSTDWELWKSNGTAGGTVFVDAMGPLTEDVSVDDPAGLTSVNGLLYFVANGGELWRSNGTSDGTFRMKEFPNNPSQLKNINGTLYFNAYNAATGRELWRSDGTTNGTFPVADVNPGGADADPAQLTSFAGGVFFTANGGSTGRELWRTDGSAEGTSLVADIRPGTSEGRPAGSGIDYLTPFGDSLFFSANDGSRGQELWRYSERRAAPAVRLARGRLGVTRRGVHAQLICPPRFNACHNVRVKIFSRPLRGGPRRLVAYRFLDVVEGGTSPITLWKTFRGRRMLSRLGGVMWVTAVTRSSETPGVSQVRLIDRRRRP